MVEPSKRNYRGGGWWTTKEWDRCPVCGRWGRCSISRSRIMAICHYVREGSIKRTTNHGYMHRIDGKRPKGGA